MCHRIDLIMLARLKSKSNVHTVTWYSGSWIGPSPNIQHVSLFALLRSFFYKIPFIGNRSRFLNKIDFGTYEIYVRKLFVLPLLEKF